MDQSRDVQQRIDRLVERAQSEVQRLSRRLAAGITKETERFVPPVSQDIERIVDEVFDFAERVMKGQRKMVSDMVKAINEQAITSHAYDESNGRHPGRQEGTTQEDGGGQEGARQEADRRQGVGAFSRT